MNQSKSILSDYIITFLSYGISLIITIFTYYYISKYCGTLEFEKYTLSKRVVSVSSVLLMGGTLVALPRFTALLSNKSSVFLTANLIASLLIVIFFTLIFIILIFGYTDYFGKLFWNTTDFNYLLHIIALSVFSGAINSIIFSFLRGLMLIGSANMFTIINVLIPSVGLFITKSVESYYWILLYINIISSTVFLIYIFRKFNLSIFFNLKLFKRQIIKLLKFGLPRVPGDFALEGLISLPVFILAHTEGSSVASMLAFAVALVSMLGSLLSPVNLILLPFSAGRISRNDYCGLRKHVKLILRIIVPLILLLSLTLFLSADFFVNNFLGKDDNLTSFFVKAVSITFVPYTLYLILRSVIDVVHFKPLNSFNIIIALISFLIVTGIIIFIGDIQYPSLYGFILSTYILGGMSYRSYVKIYN